MFSSRFSNWRLEPNALSDALRRRRESGAPVLDLTVSNPTRVGLEYEEDRILGSLQDRRSMIYEPSPAGMQEAREAVAAYYAGHGRTVSPGSIFLTASTSEAYGWLFKLLADPGDEFLVPRPSYPLFEFLAAMESVRISHYPLAYHDGWEIDLQALEEAAGPRTRGMIAVNPNNPTGSYVKGAEFDALKRFCAGKGIALIADEVFLDYSLTGDPRRIGSLAGGTDLATFCLGGLSKICALPQLKLGWIVCGGPAGEVREAAARLEIIADTYLSAGTPVQHALPRLLEGRHSIRRQIGGRCSENLAFVREAASRKTACSVLDVEGGWSAVLQVPNTRTGEEWAIALLEEDGVLVQPGYFYDFEGEAYLVVSLLTEPEPFREAIGVLLGRA